jgi:hypothetical protein
MLLFKPEFVEPILSGQKTQTRRLHNHQRRVGSIHNCQINFSSKPFCRVLITRAFKQRIIDISEADACKEGFSSREEFLRYFKRFKLDNNSIVTCYEFMVCT